MLGARRAGAVQAGRVVTEWICEFVRDVQERVRDVRTVHVLMLTDVNKVYENRPALQ